MLSRRGLFGILSGAAAALVGRKTKASCAGGFLIPEEYQGAKPGPITLTGEPYCWAVDVRTEGGTWQPLVVRREEYKTSADGQEEVRVVAELPIGACPAQRMTAARIRIGDGRCIVHELDPAYISDRDELRITWVLSEVQLWQNRGDMETASSSDR